MRLFTAVLLPDAIRNRTAEEAASILAGLPGLRRVRAPNLHITVRFLGAVTESGLGTRPGGGSEAGAVAAVERAVAGAAASVRPARVIVGGGFDAFPRPQRPRVLYRPVSDPEGVLAALEVAVSTAVEPLGFPPEPASEGRSYTPHITVARVRSAAGATAAAVILADGEVAAGKAPRSAGRTGAGRTGAGQTGAFLVTELALVESELTPHGPHYSVRAKFPLAR